MILLLPAADSELMADEAAPLGPTAAHLRGVPAAITAAGYPHLTNVPYTRDPQRRLGRVSATADRFKGRILRENPRATSHASGDHFRPYAVAECDAETSAVAAKPGDQASLEPLELRSAFYGEPEPEPFCREMIEVRRLDVRLRRPHPSTACSSRARREPG